MWLSQMVDEWSADRESASAKFDLVLPAIEALRGVPQPAANKRLLKELGVIDHERVRLPLTSMYEVPPSLDACLKLVR
jgi:dihydrodipicolinate synthase/N-acetylneuraminate lyase